VPERRQPASQRPRNLKADDTVFGVEYTDEGPRKAAPKPPAAPPADAPAGDEGGTSRRRGRYLS
jgi:hypothetical protein